MAVSRDIIEMLRGMDYQSFSSIVTQEKIKDLLQLIQEIDNAQVTYKAKYDRIEALAGDKFSLVKHDLFGNYSQGNQGFFSLDQSDKKTREKYLNLSSLINDTDITVRQINAMKKDYRTLVEKMSKLTDSLIALGLDLRGIETFETIISSRNSKGELTGYYGLNLDELSKLQENLNVIGVNFSKTGDLILGSRTGVTDVDLNKAIESIAPNSNEAQNYKELFNYMQQNGILNLTGDKNITVARFTEIIGNKDILNQIYRINENGEKQVNASLMQRLRYYQDQESFFTGNDIMTGGDYEASAKSLRSGGRGFDIVALKTLKNAVNQLQILSKSQESYEAQMALYPNAIEKKGWFFEPIINNQINEVVDQTGATLVNDIFPQEDIWITLSL